MSEGCHENLVSADLADWPGSVRKDAGNLLTALTDFEFIASFAILHSLLSSLQGITQKLQGRGIDVYEAHRLVSFRINVFELYLTLNTHYSPHISHCKC